MLTLKVKFRSFSVVSRIVLPRATPALLIRVVGLPRVLRICDAATLMDEGEVRSQWKERTEGGAGRLYEQQSNWRCWKRCFTFISQLLHIQYSDLDALLSGRGISLHAVKDDALLSKQMHDYLANAVASSRHNNHLLTPHVCVVRPIICDCIVEPCANLVRKPKDEQRLQMLPCSRMISRNATAVNCVFSSKEKRDCKQRI